jgi:hypothetical protein
VQAGSNQPETSQAQQVQRGGAKRGHHAQRNVVQVLALLRTLALNLLRCNVFHSISAGLRSVAHAISRMLGWFGISPQKGMNKPSVSTG